LEAVSAERLEVKKVIIKNEMVSIVRIPKYEFFLLGHGIFDNLAPP